MRRFRFKLDKVVQLRKWRERRSQLRLAEAHRVRESARTRLSAAAREAENERRNFSRAVEGAFTAGDALLGHMYVEKLRERVARRRDELNDSEGRVTRQRDELLEASRDRQALEILRRKRLTEYLMELQRLEQSDMDDTAGRRHLRNNQAG